MFSVDLDTTDHDRSHDLHSLDIGGRIVIRRGSAWIMYRLQDRLRYL